MNLEYDKLDSIIELIDEPNIDFSRCIRDYNSICVNIIKHSHILLDYEWDRGDVEAWIEFVISFIDQDYDRIITRINRLIEVITRELSISSNSSLNIMNTSLRHLYKCLKYELRLCSMLEKIDDIPSTIAINQGLIQHLIRVCSTYDLSFHLRI